MIIGLSIQPYDKTWTASTYINPRKKASRFTTNENNMRQVDLVGKPDIDDIQAQYRLLLKDTIIVAPDPFNIIELLDIPYGWVRDIIDVAQWVSFPWRPDTHPMKQYNERIKKLHPIRPRGSLQIELDLVRDLFLSVHNNNKKYTRENWIELELKAVANHRPPSFEYLGKNSCDLDD